MIYDKKGSTFLNGGKAMKYIFLLMLSLGGSIPCCFAGKMYTPLEKTYKVACIAEHLKKGIGNYICDTEGNIVCMPGWEDELNMCTTPICEFNGATCENGNCTEPHVCTCEIGWFGQICDHCVCLPGCVNGYCNFPMECICEEGWQGMFCDKPECGECVHGTCTSPGVCTCHPGFEGENCETCQTHPECMFGSCFDAPFQCNCYHGYEGYFCDTPICTEGCQNGHCTRPDECWCKPGYQGPTCSECVPYWNCVHGTCEQPFECNCDPGWLGMDCNATESTDGNWGTWGQWSDCDQDLNQRNRTRQCNNPPPAGNGWYCSHDGGSAGIEFEFCQGGGPPIIDGGYTQWTEFSACTAICQDESGTRTRTRTCTDPAPSNGGLTCIEQGLGPDSQEVDCIGVTPEQDVNPGENCFMARDGGYTEWTVFSPCTATCEGDQGDRRRRRFCTNPTPGTQGLTCEEQDLGPDFEDIDCVGDTPFQNQDPSEICFAIGG